MRLLGRHTGDSHPEGVGAVPAGGAAVESRAQGKHGSLPYPEALRAFSVRYLVLLCHKSMVSLGERRASRAAGVGVPKVTTDVYDTVVLAHPLLSRL
jgi:hypothetical protein